MFYLNLNQGKRYSFNLSRNVHICEKYSYFLGTIFSYIFIDFLVVTVIIVNLKMRKFLIKIFRFREFLELKRIEAIAMNNKIYYGSQIPNAFLDLNFSSVQKESTN